MRLQTEYLKLVCTIDIYQIIKNKTVIFIQEVRGRILKPIINGTGNYYIESQTRDARRTDVIVDYLGERFVVELKIWHGREYNERGQKQLLDYLDYFRLDMGYMLSFNFNKKKTVGVQKIQIEDKTVVEAVV